MKWSNELPKVPGWYWVKEASGNAHIIRVSELDSKSAIDTRGFTYSLARWQFSGPIPEPEAE